jgi:hypothetical protein
MPRTVRPRFEPDIDDSNDPKTERDRLYAELRTIADLCQKLSDRTRRVAIRRPTLPVGPPVAE